VKEVKKIVTVLLVVLLALSLAGTATAADPPDVAPIPQQGWGAIQVYEIPGYGPYNRVFVEPARSDTAVYRLWLPPSI
jgi:hypothetical protein